MAATQSKKKTASASSGGSRAKGAGASGSRKKNSRSAPPPKKPIRREVGGLVFLALALFSGVGYFQTEAIFIHLFSNLLKGLFGYGFWVIPPAFFITGLILLLHHGRPVRLRVGCMLVFPVSVGVVLQMLLCKEEFMAAFGILATLYRSGLAMTSGGVVCGGIGYGFEQLFGAFASTVVCVLLAAVCLLVALQVNPKTVYETSRSRRVEYEPDPDYERVRMSRITVKETQRRRKPQIDIPLDDEPESAVRSRAAEMEAGALEGKAPRASFFNRKSSVPKPHELLGTKEKMKDVPPEPADVPAVPAEQNTVDAAARCAAVPAQDSVPDWPAVEIPDAPFSAAAEAVRTGKPPVMSKPEPPASAAEESAPVPEVKLPSKKQTAAEVAAATAAVTAEIDGNEAMDSPYEYPPYDLLSDVHPGNVAQAQAEQQRNLERLCNTLESFGVRAQAGDVVRGPSVTRYEFRLEQGVKLNKVTSLSDDLALALGVGSIRIAPIPEKNSVIGIEVPNKHSSMVLIRDVLEGRTFREHASRVAFSIGRDIAGRDIVGNISKLPHVLIAGTTGSGKSVCINSLIVSLLYKATPDEVRFIMVDPKMVELNPYNGIPHLLIPVVTDPKKAAGALQWAVFEMMKRYKAFSEHNVKDLASFNRMAAQDDALQTLPTVVVVIDELADLMMVAAKEVEESICRVAQMGRAAGVHLVIATQRPSADIITGVMKANIPSRIAFAVASSMESRIILDMTGAEKLVGKGDMLYFPVGSSKPQRVQGCMITEEEIDRVVSFVKQSGEAHYSDEVMQKIEESLVEKDAKGASQAAAEVAESTDPLFDDAVEVLLETGQASVSMLQRRLKLGYSRAARLIDQMEERGVVGPFEGSKPRQLLVSRASWEAYKNGGASPVEEGEYAPAEDEPAQIDIPIPDLPEGNGESVAPWDQDAPKDAER